MESFVLDLSMSGDCGVTNSQGIEPFSYFGYLFCLLGHRTLTYGFSDSGLFVSPDLNRTTPSLKGFNILLYKHSYRYTNSLIGYCMYAFVLCLNLPPPSINQSLLSGVKASLIASVFPLKSISDRICCGLKVTL